MGSAILHSTYELLALVAVPLPLPLRLNLLVRHTPLPPHLLVLRPEALIGFHPVRCCPGDSRRPTIYLGIPPPSSTGAEVDPVQLVITHKGDFSLGDIVGFPDEDVEHLLVGKRL